ncbi:MAG: hypothetical protein Q8N53_14960, partial [Longimicrobiales bacterium]|nr:hypothetical protein [Longimicrobiales bacterium]
MKAVTRYSGGEQGQLPAEVGQAQKSVITPRNAAYVGSAAVLLVGWLVPALLPGTAVFDPAVAVNVVVAIAIIFTAAFAAENLQEFRKASEAEYTPVLHCQLVEVREGR